MRRKRESLRIGSSKCNCLGAIDSQSLDLLALCDVQAPLDVVVKAVGANVAVGSNARAQTNAHNIDEELMSYVIGIVENDTRADVDTKFCGRVDANMGGDINIGSYGSTQRVPKYTLKLYPCLSIRSTLQGGRECTMTVFSPGWKL